jgi:hypothetical protein
VRREPEIVERHGGEIVIDEAASGVALVVVSLPFDVRRPDRHR